MEQVFKATGTFTVPSETRAVTLRSWRMWQRDPNTADATLVFGSGTGTGTGSAPGTERSGEPLSWQSFEAWYDRWRRTVLTKEEHEAAERAKQ